MKDNYKHIFDTMYMSPEHQKEIRSKLSICFAKAQKENISANKKLKITRFAAIAASVILVLILVGFTFNYSKIIYLLGGGRIETGTNSDGNSFVSIDTGFEADPVKVQDNQIYFTLDGSNKNITEQCSDKTYYQYESISASGSRHIILIGGTPDNIGWAEFSWDQNGIFIGYNATYNNNVEPAWLISGKTALGV